MHSSPLSAILLPEMPRQVKTGLAEKVLNGDVQAAARLISLLEDDAPEAFAELDRLYPSTGKACIIGVTGAPGVGKSTLADCLVGHFRRQGKTVGVIAIDPTSTRTGGALLGDRVRMQRHSADPGVFIRSLATRGWAGGLARAALSAVHVMDALGRDVVLVETVGSGQVETDIVRAADTALLVMAPGAGDDIQAMKAGSLETADIIVVNKADKAGADYLKGILESAIGMAGASDWRTPVLFTEATIEKGIDGLAETIWRHREFLEKSGGLARRRRQRLRLELLGAVEGRIKDMLHRLDEGEYLEKLMDDIQEGRKNPRAAAQEIIDQLK
jgi:LAO/AO transport system kinase